MNNACLRISDLILKYKLREAQGEMMRIARTGNKYLADNEPWKLVKLDASRVETIMSVALEITRCLSIAAMPFLPNTAQKLQGFLNIDAKKWSDLLVSKLVAGTKINQAEILFKKIDDEFVEFEIQKLREKSKQTSKFLQ